jgi:hypothetical protein
LNQEEFVMLRLKHLTLFTGPIFMYFVSVPAVFGWQGETDQEGINARDTFWSAEDLIGKPLPHRPPHLGSSHPTGLHPVDRTGGSLVHALGLRYSVLKQRPDGTFEEVSLRTTFRAGDTIRISVMPNQEGYLYIIEKGSSGAWLPLYPRAGSEGTNRLMPGQEYIVPGGGSWVFDNHPGEERVFVLLTRSPEPDMDHMIASLKSARGEALTASNSISSQFVERLRSQEEEQSRDLVFTKSDELPASSSNLDKPDKADYVVNTAIKDANPHVMVDVVLVHH